jgi:hypothetical protein
VGSRPVPPPLDSAASSEKEEAPPKEKEETEGGADSVSDVGAVGAGAERVEAAAVSHLTVHKEVDVGLGTSVADLAALGMAVLIKYRSTTVGGSVLEGSGLDGGVLSAEDSDVGGKNHIQRG